MYIAIRIWYYYVMFFILAQWKFLYCIDRFDHIKANKSKLINKRFYLWIDSSTCIFTTGDDSLESLDISRTGSGKKLNVLQTWLV